MSALIWYKFSGYCNNSIFQVQVSDPPYGYTIGEYYYVATNIYSGCTVAIATGYTSGVTIHSFA